jgi:hypothetical protein
MAAAGKSISVWKVLFWAMLPAGIVLLTLVAILLFLNWRTIHRWESYRKAALAEGRIVDTTLPPSIEPAQNFAAGPLFSAIPCDKNGDPLRSDMLPKDWLPVELLPDLTKGRHADLAAIAGLFKIPAEPVADQASAILAACDENLRHQWPAVLAAEARPLTRFGIHHGTVTRSEKFPYVDLKTAVRVHELRAVTLLHAGRGSEAVGEVHGALRIAAAAATESHLIGRMAYTQFVGLQTEVVWEGLALGAWSDTDLAALEQDLAPQRVSAGYARAHDFERAYLNAVLDSVVDRSALRARLDPMRDWFPGKESIYSFMRAVYRIPGVVRDNQLLMNRQWDVQRTRIDDQGNWQPKDLPFDPNRTHRVEKMRYLLAAIALPDFSRPEKRLLAIEARLRQARLAIAVERFRRVHGHLPEHLDEVVPQFLPSVLLDPMDHAPMRYARNGAEHFRLWSVGDDREDDGGKPDPELTDVTLDLVWPGGQL